jgi:hypothetical protein
MSTAAADEEAAALLAQLCALECELHGLATRTDAGRLAELLHPAFREFGRSGRAYSRAEILAQLLAETQAVEVQAQDFVLQPLAEGVALLSYRSAHRQPDGTLLRHTHRSSVWKREALGWQMLFHQGTPTEGCDAVG